MNIGAKNDQHYNRMINIFYCWMSNKKKCTKTAMHRINSIPFDMIYRFKVEIRFNWYKSSICEVNFVLNSIKSFIPLEKCNFRWNDVEESKIVEPTDNFIYSEKSHLQKKRLNLCNITIISNGMLPTTGILYVYRSGMMKWKWNHLLESLFHQPSVLIDDKAKAWLLPSEPIFVTHEFIRKKRRQ